MRIAKVIAVMVFGPLLGTLAGVVLGGLKIRADPMRQPGFHLVLVVFAFLGFVISIPVSVMLAVAIWRSSGTVPKSK